MTIDQQIPLILIPYLRVRSLKKMIIPWYRAIIRLIQLHTFPLTHSSFYVTILLRPRKFLKKWLLAMSNILLPRGQILIMLYDIESRSWGAFEPLRLLVQVWCFLGHLLTKWKQVFRFPSQSWECTNNGGVFSWRQLSAYSQRNLSTHT